MHMSQRRFSDEGWAEAVLEHYEARAPATPRRRAGTRHGRRLRDR